MTTEHEVENVENAEPVEQVDTETTDYEARARAHGWKPKEEFVGDETKWVDAKEFVELGEKKLPILRETNRRLESKINSMQQSIQKMQAIYEAREKAAVAEAIEKLKAERREAIEDGDYSRVEQIEKKIDNTRLPEVQQPDERYVRFVNECDWFTTSSRPGDPYVTQYAVQVEKELQRDYPDVEERLQKVRERVEERFATRLGIAPKAPRGGVPVEATRRTPAPQKDAFAALPAEVKQVAEMQIKEGLFKDKADYLTYYNKSFGGK